MKIKALVVPALIYFVNFSFSQSVRITPVHYKVDTFFDSNKSVKFSCGPNKLLQGEFVISLVSYKAPKDTMIFFRTEFIDSRVVSKAEWFEADGSLKKLLETDSSHLADAYPVTLEAAPDAGLQVYVYPQNFVQYEKGIIVLENLFTDGILSIQRLYYPNGKKKSTVGMYGETKTKNGTFQDFELMWKKYGDYTLYHENGDLKISGFYLHDEPTSTWKYFAPRGVLESEEHYHADGSIEYIFFYASGAIHKNYHQDKRKVLYGDFREYYENGQISLKTHYNKKGERDSVEMGYYENGKIKHELSCCTQNKIYQYKSWHENGKLASIGAYDRYGSEEGKWEYYNKNGKLDSIRDFTLVQEMEEIGFGPFPIEEEYFRNSSLMPLTFELPKLHMVTGNFPIKTNPGLKFMKKHDPVYLSLLIKNDGTYSLLSCEGLNEKEKTTINSHLKGNWRSISPMNFGGKSISSEVKFVVTWIADEN